MLQRQPVEGEPDTWGDDADMEGQRDAGGDVTESARALAVTTVPQ